MTAENFMKLSASPHIHSGASTTKIMGDVLVSLLPASLIGVWVFGLSALAVLSVCVGTAVASEWVFNIILKRGQTVSDLSAAVTGLLLALSLPSDIPLWQCVIGTVFSIVIVKSLFGGIGKNIVNPAICGRVFMLLSFSEAAGGDFPRWADAVSSATPLITLDRGESVGFADLLLGNRGGAIGEVAILALLVGGVYLLLRGVISWHIPTAFLASVFVLTLPAVGFDFGEAARWLFSGSAVLGAIYMATDYVTSPVTKFGKVIFGVGCGALTVLIRLFGSYPEGVSFAILLMNVLTPHIDRLTPKRVFGGI